MAVLWSTPELAARFSKYVEELRDYLASYSMHYGSADDLGAVATRLDADEPFREDLASLVRATILREGGVVPRANLLEILAIAIGGSDFDQAGNTAQLPLRQLLAFVNRVTAKPWNQPPGEARLTPETIPATIYEMPPPPVREESPAAPPQTPAAAHGESPMEGYGAMLAARHQVVPISAHRPLESREPASTASHAEWLIASGGTISPPNSLSEGKFSRLNHVERQAGSGLTPTPIPGPAATPIPPPPPPPVTTAPASAFEFHPAPALHPAPAAFAPPPAPAAATEVQDAEPGHRTVFLSTSGPEPPSLPLMEGVPARKVSGPSPFFPKFSVPKLPKFSMPKFSAPAFSVPKLPKFSAAKFSIPGFSPPRMTLSKLSLSRMSPFLIFGAALAGACVAVFATVRVLVSHPRSQPQSTARILSLSPPTAAAATVATAATPPAATPIGTAVAPNPAPAPSTVRPSKPSAYGSPRYDNYIAKPYSRPIPGQPGAAASTSAASTPSSQSSSSQPQASDLRPASFSGPANAARPAKPIDPDATYVGASAEERAADLSESNLPPPPRRRYPTVSAGVMKNNLVSAPAPGYPWLAKMTHIQGQVVVQAIVAPDGTVSDAHVLRGHHLLRGAAVDAVRRWRYRPYTIDGRPAEVSTTITLNFPGTASQQVSKSASLQANSQTHESR